MKKIMLFLVNWIDSFIMHSLASAMLILAMISLVIPQALRNDMTSEQLWEILYLLDHIFIVFALLWSFLSVYFKRIKGSTMCMVHWVLEIMMFVLCVKSTFELVQGSGVGLVETLLHGPKLLRLLFAWTIYAGISETVRYQYKEYRRKNRHKIKKEKTTKDVLSDVRWAILTYSTDRTIEFGKKRATLLSMQHLTKSKATPTASVKKQSAVSTQSKTANSNVKKEEKKVNVQGAYKTVLSKLQAKGYQIFFLKNDFTVLVKERQCCVIKYVTKQGKYTFENDTWFLNGKTVSHFGKGIQSISAKLRAQCGAERTYGLIAKCFNHGQIAGKSGFKIMNTEGAEEAFIQSVEKHVPSVSNDQNATLETVEKIRKAFQHEILKEGV